MKINSQTKWKKAGRCQVDLQIKEEYQRRDGEIQGKVNGKRL
jgi:hypothetical protein